MRHRGRPERWRDRLSRAAYGDDAGRWAGRMKNPLVFVVLPLVLTGVLVSSAFGIGGARSAESGHGDRGTFTAGDCTSQKCGRRRGIFVPDDGTAPRRVEIQGRVSSYHQQVRAIDPGGGTVYPLGTHMGLLYAIMLPLSGCGLLAWLLWAVGFARVFIPEVREDPWADQDEPGRSDP